MASPGRGRKLAAGGKEDPEALIIVGEITRSHGLSGAVRVFPVTDFPDHLLDLARVVVVRGVTTRPARSRRHPPRDRSAASRSGSRRRPTERATETRYFRVEQAEAAGRFVVMKLSGIETPEAAEALRGATIRISSDDARPLPPGQYYVFQIVGLRVRTPDGRVLGRVADVLRTGSNDVYVVRTDGASDLLLPAVDGVVQRIDLGAAEMIVSPPEWM